MTSPESSTPTPEPQREPDGDSTEQVNPGPPLNVLDQILSALLEAVDASRGDLDSVDIDALASRFPRHREVVYEEWEALCVRSRKAGKIGPYLRVREVGKGGMGTVWEAFDPRLKRPIAIKQLKAPHI
ncbi:MAG TPA: hypothetical protein ENK43_03180, partial [Planctomycetes bacterium]|nr:hypothetical protein [Planctomycetota bacterium]